jgi:hypothetical protein
LSLKFTLQRLDRAHNRDAFRCIRDEGILERYLRDDSRALREHEKSVCSVHVLLDVEREPPKIAGYFTLSSETIVPDELPPKIAKKYSRYPRWGAVKLGRMARDDAYGGQDIGITLVRAAFQIFAGMNDVGAIAMVVDAKNADLASWYERVCGFIPFESMPLTLFIMKPTIERILAAGNDT